MCIWVRYVELDYDYLMGIFFGSGFHSHWLLTVVLRCYLTAFGNRFHAVICSVMCGNAKLWIIILIRVNEHIKLTYPLSTLPFLSSDYKNKKLFIILLDVLTNLYVCYYITFSYLFICFIFHIFSLKMKLLCCCAHVRRVTENCALCWTVFIYRELFKSW